MRYPVLAVPRKEGGLTLQFPACPDLDGVCEEPARLQRVAREAVERWLTEQLAGPDLPPQPPTLAPRVPRGARLSWVTVSPRLAARIVLRRARERAELTQVELARRVGVSQPAVAQLEGPRANPTLGTLERVAAALGCRLEIALVPETDPAGDELESEGGPRQRR
jgi:DNA-binding XRE family transcriptional regulator